jgi:hypothetical protein
VKDWRSEHPEEDVLSTCSTLIAVIDDGISKVVQFSHFSVKEFLTSDRLQSSQVENIRNYYVPLEPAHAILARTCLTVLLQLDKDVDKQRLVTFPLAIYAAQHWVDHAKYGDVASRIQGVMEDLFDPTKPYLAAWTWIHDPESVFKQFIGERPSPLRATPLYYASLCGFSGLADHLIVTHAQDVNARCGLHGTPLHAASSRGHVGTVRVLLDHRAQPNARDGGGKSPLYTALSGNHLKVMRLLLERGANVDAPDGALGTLLHDSSCMGQVEVVQQLLLHKANLNARGFQQSTPLYFASLFGRTKIVQLLLEHGAEVGAQPWVQHIPLFVAVHGGYVEMARLLIDHRADVHFRDHCGWTLLQVATQMGHHDVAQLLLKHDAGKV